MKGKSIFNDALRAFRSNTFAVFLLTVLFLITPGIAVLFYFRPDLVAALDWIKLLLLALASTSPLVFLNTMIAFAKEVYQDEPEISAFKEVTFAVTGSGFIIYAALLVAYVFSLIFWHFLIVLAVFEVIVVLALHQVARENHSKPADKTVSQD